MVPVAQTPRGVAHPNGPDLVAGPVEVDEAYLGGREKNKHTGKKGKRKKTAVVGIMDRTTGIIRAITVSLPSATCIDPEDGDISPGIEIDGADNMDTDRRVRCAPFPYIDTSRPMTINSGGRGLYCACPAAAIAGSTTVLWQTPI